ncbi:uncharacterized protein B0H18DRAFT_1209606 [Fomitopsis serialis]|uniref:uncharacterized protein n=1 Tax=Fomitopsis serialis TaxID=139415 RepID=UPI0020082541|nr:uncharacterized protein B0H18DRAFT_1209606 [Neoantrodia serialis]KAH9930114.1 hypothetical protein B0H18DRAFT_1209606 [Neoantrodia serialis]
MYGTHPSRKSGVAITNKKQTLRTSEVNKDPDSWAAEIDGKINLFDKSHKEFFEVYVPFEDPFGGARPWDDPAAVFADVRTVGRETAMYPALISGLQTVVHEFELERRPQFADSSKCAVRFPFSAWEDEHMYTIPDILMSFPGEDDEAWGKSWHSISMVFEIKPGKCEDPIGKYSTAATAVLTQLAKSARNIMLTHGRLFVFVVGIYGNLARIYRFDHAAGVASRAFDYKKDPWPLHELIWRFCHHRARVGGRMGAPFADMVLGADPSLQRATEEDIKLADEECIRAGRARLTEDEKQACRWMTAIKYNEDGAEVGATRYLLCRLRFLNPRLFSRSTTVWDALEEGTWQLCAIKDAWRQLARDREDVLYDRLCKAYRNRPWWEMVEDYVFMHRKDEPGPDRPSLPDGGFELDDEGHPILTEELEDMVVAASLDIGVTELYGLPDVVYGGDLGALEAAKVLLKSRSSSSSEVSGADLVSVASHADRPLAYEAYHRTVCGWNAQKAKYNERSHMRLVMSTVGRPLSDFRSTKELVRALRDAIHGHRQAYLAGTIHRDISEGNVMIVDDWMCFFVGFLLDLDYAFDWKAALGHAGWPINETSWKRFVEEYNRSLPHRARPAPPETEIPVLVPPLDAASAPGGNSDREIWKTRMKLKERTGTLFFMAIEILLTYVVHDVRHDLESAFWLLLCMILRHTKHTSSPQYMLYLRVFGAENELDSAGRKQVFLSGPMEWEIKDNKPLTTLVRKFKTLCKNNLPNYDDPSSVIPLTYESVLSLFDEALADPSWPENDCALPFKLPRDDSDIASATGGSGKSRQRKKRDRDPDQKTDSDEDEGDPFGPRAAKRTQVGSLLRNEVGQIVNRDGP